MLKRSVNSDRVSAKRKNLLIILCLSIGTMLQAQQSDLAVIAPAGSSDETTSLTLDWTLGELAVQSLEDFGVMLTEGFHQTWLFIEDILNPPEDSSNNQFTVSVSPNPTPAELHIKIDSYLEGKGALALNTLNGQLMKYETINLSSGDHEWSMANYPAGLYILTLKTEKGELLKSFKITKIH